MKSKLKLGMGILVLSIGILTIGCKGTSQKENANTSEDLAVAVYTCPMHPEVQQNEPGNCPICGMNLEETRVDMHHSNMQMDDIVYTCPMHPEVVKHEPGSCPECGMDLVMKEADMEHSHEEQMH